MWRYQRLAILTAGLWISATAAVADNPAATTQSAPAADTSIHAMAATSAQAATTAPPPAAAITAAPAATTEPATPVARAISAPAVATTSMPAENGSGPSMPTRGMSMENVEHIFGTPQEKLAAVPDPGTKLHPPITRWIYPNYVVYFEYNYVIHTVLKDHPFNNDSSKN